MNSQYICPDLEVFPSYFLNVPKTLLIQNLTRNKITTYPCFGRWIILGLGTIKRTFRTSTKLIHCSNFWLVFFFFFWPSSNYLFWVCKIQMGTSKLQSREYKISCPSKDSRSRSYCASMFILYLLEKVFLDTFIVNVIFLYMQE